jgi:tripartite-type tricarboxylate transporter receptor subunit TctC
MMTKITLRSLCAALLAQLVLVPDFLYSQSDFYKGKTVTLIHGRSAGGSGEYRARSVAPFLQKYIPGNPTIVHEYMDGGGGRKAANHIFNTARPDGLTIGSVGSGVVVSAVLGETGVQYDLDKLHFVGSPYSATHYLLLTRRETGLTTLDKLRQASGVRLGGQSVGHSNYTVGRIMAWLLGLKEVRDVTGFSNPERRIALIRGEIDAIAVSDSGLLDRQADWLEKGLVDLHVIFAVPRENKHPRFNNLPEIDGFAKTERERKVVTMFRNFSLTGAPFILPPAMPKERVEIIKEALRKSFKDPAFFQEYRKLVGDDPSPLTPEENEKAIRDLPRDAESVELYKKFAGPGPLPPR